MQKAVSDVKVDDSLLDYAMEIVERTRQTEQLSLGVSPRGTVMLHRAAQARAFIEGRDYCLPDDFKQLIVPVFAHRVVVSSRYVSDPEKVRAERGNSGRNSRNYARTAMTGAGSRS